MSQDKNDSDWNNTKESTSNFGINLIFFFYRIGGWKLVKIVIFFITIFVYLFNSRARRLSKEFGARFKSYSNQQIKFSSFKHIFRFCESILEKVLAWKGLIEISKFNSIERAHERMLEKASLNEGALLIGSHIGNMEMMRAMNQFISKKKIKIFMQVSNSKTFISYLKSINEDSNLDLIVADEINPGTIIELSECVKRGEWVVILGDRLLSPNSRSVKVKFLNGDVLMPQGPWILAHLLGVPVYTIYSVKISGTPSIIFNEWGMVRLSSKDRELSISSLAQKFADEMAIVLQKAPHDWFNFYSYWLEDK